MATTDINSQPVDGLWLTISDLARQKGTDKAAISRRITRFEAEGLLTTRPGSRGSKLVNVAEYERVAGQHLDATKELAAQTSAYLRGASPPADPVDPQNPSLAREQARRTAYQADIARISLGERTRRLVPVDRIADEAARLVEPIVKALDRLPSHADAIVAAHNESGHQGVRAVLKDIVAQTRNAVARALDELAASLAAEPARPLAEFDPNPAAPQPEEPDAEA